MTTRCGAHDYSDVAGRTLVPKLKYKKAPIRHIDEMTTQMKEMKSIMIEINKNMIEMKKNYDKF